MVSRHLELLRTNCVQNVFIESFIYQKNTKFVQNCQKMDISNFFCIGRKMLKQKQL